MALDHDKIFKYLSSDISQHMRSAFRDGSVAATPPATAQETTIGGDEEDENVVILVGLAVIFSAGIIVPRSFFLQTVCCDCKASLSPPYH
jgi:hypothetical protein